MSDVLPTVLTLAGLPVPEKIDGEDVSEMLARDGETPHRQAFWANGDQLAVREGPWKLVLRAKLDFDRALPEEVHLSNLDDDPGERVNLAGRRPDLARRLSEGVTTWHGGLAKL